jgi:hypothetical protein
MEHSMIAAAALNIIKNTKEIPTTAPIEATRIGNDHWYTMIYPLVETEETGYRTFTWPCRDYFIDNVGNHDAKSVIHGRMVFDSVEGKHNFVVTYR